MAELEALKTDIDKEHEYQSSMTKEAIEAFRKRVEISNKLGGFQTPGAINFKGKDIIILAMGPGRGACPFDAEVWALNQGYLQIAQMRGHINKLFLAHTQVYSKSGNPYFDWDELNYMAEHGVEIINTHRVKKLKMTLFPRETIKKRFGIYYFEDTICYMIAYALYLYTKVNKKTGKPYLSQPLRLRLYGVDIQDNHEYGHEKPGIEFWLGYAMGLGAEITTTIASTLLTHDCGLPYGDTMPPEEYDPTNILGTFNTQSIDIGNITLYKYDCENILPYLLDKSVQMVCTSPSWHCDNLDMTEDSNKYLQFIVNKLAGIKRVLKDNGVIYLHVGNREGFDIPGEASKVLQQSGWLIPKIIQWNSDKILVLTKQNDYLYRNNGFGDVWDIPTTRGLIWCRSCDRIYEARYGIEDNLSKNICGCKKDINMVTGFGAVMPEEVAKRCVLMSSNEGDTVLDIFAGTGTLGIVAVKLGRKAILIEKDNKTLSMAIARIKQTILGYFNK